MVCVLNAHSSQMACLPWTTTSLRTGGGFLYFRSISDEQTTLTELKAMAAPATQGGICIATGAQDSFCPHPDSAYSLLTEVLFAERCMPVHCMATRVQEHGQSRKGGLRH